MNNFENMETKNLTSEEAAQSEYSVFICALGFEARSTAVARRIAGRYQRGFALGFDKNHECSYAENETWFRTNSFEIIADLSSANFSLLLAQYIDPYIYSGSSDDDHDDILRIGIDVSSFDRKRLAELVNWVSSIRRRIQVDFWYCIAAFHPPSPTAGRNEIAGPVHRKFAGRFVEPGRPLALLAGLGYELGRVMGAAEYLQASRIVAFIPTSPVLEYENEVVSANSAMLQDLEPRQILRYPVANPERTLAMLDSTIRGLEREYNIVLLPGGPKVFALCSLLACTIHRNSAVWRVSSGTSIKPRDVLPSNHFITLRWQKS